MGGIDIKRELLEEDVRIHYHIRQCPGVKDNSGEITISYSHISSLPILPKKTELSRDEYIEEIFIPKANKTIAFVINSWWESSAGRMYTVTGPYCKPE